MLNALTDLDTNNEFPIDTWEKDKRKNKEMNGKNFMAARSRRKFVRT